MEKAEFCALGGGMFTLLGSFNVGKWGTSLDERRAQLMGSMRGIFSMNARVSKDITTEEEV